MKAILFFLTLLFYTTNALAEKVEIDGIYYDLKPIKVGTASVTYAANHEYVDDVIIPTTIEYEGNTYRITEIGAMAFYADKITSVTLPNTLETIEKEAFKYCQRLTSINIPESTRAIKEKAFEECTALSKVEITSIASWCKIDFEDYANPLYYSHNLSLNGDNIVEIEIPTEIKEIKRRTFNGFSNLQTVHLHDELNTIGEYAFAWCTSLKEISLPNSITKIDNYAFTADASLQKIIIPSNLECLSCGVFSKCSGLSFIDIPHGVNIIETYAFEKCTGLKTLKISNSVNYMENLCFDGCENLEDVYCFCLNLPSVTSQYYKPGVTNRYFNKCFVEKTTLHVPTVALDKYKTTYPWSEFGTIIPLTDDEINGINPIIEIKLPQTTYTISGQKTKCFYKGIIIRDGKKYIIK